jgi:DNA-binding NarL/FixJ family response regulator
MIKCVMVEDQVMFEQLLRTFLGSDSQLDFVATVHSVAEGIEACRKHMPELLLLDLSLPDGDGTDVARFLKKHRPDSRCIVLSAQADTFLCPPDLRDTIEAVINKTEAFTILHQEVSCVIQKLCGDMKATKKNEILLKIDTLTRREKIIFQRIGEGRSNKEIASLEFISPHTVDTHRKNIAAKLGTSASALVRLATMHNLTKPMHPPG